MHIERIQIEEEFLNAFGAYPRAGLSAIAGARARARPRSAGSSASASMTARFIRTSAVDRTRWTTEASTRCLSSQNQVLDASSGDLDRDVVVVLFEGPRSNRMPVLHEITPALDVLRDKGDQVAFFTDGRMQCASRNGPKASHVSAQVLPDSPLARLPRDSEHAGSGASAMLEARDAEQP